MARTEAFATAVTNITSLTATATEFEAVNFIPTSASAPADANYTVSMLRIAGNQ